MAARDDIQFEERWDADGRRELHALIEGDDVGFVAAPLKGDSVEDIYVRPEYRRQGIATALWSEQWQRDWGLTHSARRTIEGDAWAAHVAREFQESLPPLAGGPFEHADPQGRPVFRHATLRDQLVDYQGRQTGLEATDEGNAIVCEINGAFAGNIIYEVYDDCVFVLHLWVEPQHRGSGIGTCLARQVKAQFPDLPLDQEIGGNPNVRALFAALNRPPLPGLDAAPPSAGRVSSEQLERMRAFLKDKWAERSREIGRDAPQDLTGACIFATAFAQRVLGGEVRGNWHHTYLALDDQIIDLTEAEGVREQALEREQLHAQYPSMRSPHFVGPDVDPHMHDPAFLATKDFLETWDSVQERSRQWADEFIQLERAHDLPETSL